jgi:hypothetical protein
MTTERIIIVILSLGMILFTFVILVQNEVIMKQKQEIRELFQDCRGPRA